MRRAILLGLMLAAPLARAQDDAPIPYSDQETDDRDRPELPGKSDRTTGRRDETEVEQQDRAESLANIDDPSIGLSAEIIVGAMLVDSARGALFDGLPSGGFRFTWEWTRTVFSDELFRELSFVDVAWWHAGNSEGTPLIYAKSYYNYFSFAPAFSYPFGPKSPVSVFAQLGIGVVFNPTVIVINQEAFQSTALKLLIQYGAGLRFRPLIVTWGRKSRPNADFAEAQDGLRLSFRLEVTRFRRGYVDDTYLGGSLGVTF